MPLRVTLLALAVAGFAAACVPVPPPPPPPLVQTCDVHWRGYVVPSDHNYAGIGAYNGSDRYMCKPTPVLGVRAQIQHLRNYADPGSRHYNLGAPFEPRPKYDAAAFDSFVYKGAAPTWEGLEGRWAVPGHTYWDKIKNICDNMRARFGIGPLANNTSIMGPSTLNAAQIGAHVRAIGNPWKPEISPEAMAQLYIDEGNKAGVRGDVAFCQSILETGWFWWPNSPASAAEQQAATATAPDESTTTTTTLPGDPSTTTSTPGDTTTTTAPAPPPLDPGLDGYFELKQVRIRY